MAMLFSLSKPDKGLEELVSQMDELSNEKTRLLAENEKLSDELAAGTKRLEELKKSEESKSSSVTKLVRERESLMNQLSWSESQRSILSSEITDLKRVVQDLSSSKKATIRDAEEKECDLKAMTKDLEVLEEQYKEQIAYNSALDNELARSMRRREILECRICDLESCLIQQEERNSDAMKKITTRADERVHILEMDLEELRESR